MIHFRCPKCEQPIEAAPNAVGRQVLCGSCRALVLVPGDNLTAAPNTDAPLNRRQFYRQLFGTFAFLIPLALAAIGYGGYMAYQRWIVGNVSVYVDNTGDQPLTVSLDSDVKATVAPGTFGVIKCRDGSHRLEVKRNGQIVFDETKDLSKPADKDKPTKYLINPGATGRYHKHSVQYGVAFMPWGLANLKPIIQRFQPMIANDANLFPGLREEDVKHDLFWACSEVSLIEPAVWQDISNFDIVLERAPKQIKGEITGKQEVFARLSKADYDSIVLIRSNDKMTKPELANVVRALERIVQAELPQ